ncbi:hypothetical protein Hanom_Chr01g00069251 [Helianthus anomalus]
MSNINLYRFKARYTTISINKRNMVTLRQLAEKGPSTHSVQFRSLKGLKRCFGRFGDERVMHGMKEETKPKNQGSTVNYGGHRKFTMALNLHSSIVLQ